jgi:hypothetical protein
MEVRVHVEVELGNLRAGDLPALWPRILQALPATLVPPDAVIEVAPDHRWYGTGATTPAEPVPHVLRASWLRDTDDADYPPGIDHRAVVSEEAADEERRTAYEDGRDRYVQVTSAALGPTEASGSTSGGPAVRQGKRSRSYSLDQVGRVVGEVEEWSESSR